VPTLFESFWAAIDGNALSGLDRTAASAAFLSSLLECVVFMIRRLLGDHGKLLLSDDQTDTSEAAQELVKEQVKLAWEALSTGRLKLEPDVAAAALSKTLIELQAINDGTAVYLSMLLPV
jgi:E3 ubiquitin-protein ligase listerin